MDEHVKHPYDWNAKLVRFFLGNSRLVWLILIAIVVGGVFALLNLRREGFPAATPKVVVIQTIFPGATADEVERQVTSVIEGAVKDVRGLKNTSSTSANSFSNVVVTLDESVNLDTGIQDVQTKVQAVRGELPNDAEQPRVQTFNTSGPAFTFGVTNTSGFLNYIRQDAERIVEDIEQVDGVKSAEVMNSVVERIVIRWRPADLIRTGVSLQTIQLALQGSNVNFPIGLLDLDNKEQSVVAVGSFTSLDDIRTLVIGGNPQTGQIVTLNDVADISRGYPEQGNIERFGYRKYGRLTSANGVLLSVNITADADIIRTRQAITDRLATLRKEGRLPTGVEVVTLSDQAKDTSDQITEIVEGAIGGQQNFWLLGGLQLLFIAMLLLVNWRAAIVAALAIPISLLFTFLTLFLFGVQLNTIVLFSLILVLGLIVDPAIVMVEAIQRYRDLKYGPNEAILESGRRYGASLFMAVLAAMVVFAPFGVVSGIFGEIIRYIPLTVIPALVASYLVPIAILPVFSKWFLKTHRPAYHHDGRAHESEGLWAMARWFMSAGQFLLKSKWRQLITLVVALVLVIASISIVATGRVQIVQFSTPQDNQLVSIDARFPNGLTFVDRSAAAEHIEQLVLRERGVAKYFYYQQNADGLFLFIELLDKDERGESDASKAIVARLRQEVKNVPHLDDVLVGELGVGPPESDYQIQVQLNDNDPVVLEKGAKAVGNYLREVEHVTRVDDGYTQKGEPEVQIVLNRVKVQQAGLSSFEIGQQLKAILDETETTKFLTEDDQRLDVILVNDLQPSRIDQLGDLALISRTPSADGTPRLIPLKDVAMIESTTAVDAIRRFDGQRFISVRARINDSKNLITVQQKLNEYLTEDRLVQLGIDSRDSRGEFDDIAKSFQDLGIALVVAVLLTYTLLVLQFRSFSQPLVMLVTVPLSLTGVFPALVLTGSDLGFLELLGVTILVGIVVSVGIFLMDYANQLVKEQGLSPQEAIIQATGVRFRPIVLTKLVVLGGLLPLAIESEFWRGLAVVIIGGIGLSGFLSLIVIPILYVWIEGGRRRLHRRHAHRP